MQVDGARVLITGGASGLGRATAEGFLEAGAKVAVFDLPVSGANAPEGSHFEGVDVTHSTQITEGMAGVEAALGGLDVLVNCAGIALAEKTLGRDGPHDMDVFSRTLAINLGGSFDVLRQAAALMARNEAGRDGQRGVVVNTASVAAFDGQKGQAAYAASKAGIAGLSLPVARDLARSGIRIMAIAPGIFRTPMLEGLGQDVMDGLAEDVCFPKRLGDPAEFASLARFIVSCDYLNGETIRLDGALRMP
ncbi:SDR family NAD(P)-dependent oxidoreductase [Alphaproteobacteria bacterium KMM 3653]|uniref:SDR family NAD(P)-dependent oxidoreductase n=1 Tax=Harenicola maris TaxID=2841044 RepID=A0AAP2CSW1_9RHOB|nr:SDR family NAD(P)-dependent oxidoreductase [Harenicola maris]